MCSMLRSDPVTRLSTQVTRWPRARRASQRCDPRNPAPPVTTEVGTGGHHTRRGARPGRPFTSSTAATPPAHQRTSSGGRPPERGRGGGGGGAAHGVETGVGGGDAAGRGAGGGG